MSDLVWIQDVFKGHHYEKSVNQFLLWLGQKICRTWSKMFAWVKRHHNFGQDQARQYWFRSGPSIRTKRLDAGTVITQFVVYKVGFVSPNLTFSKSSSRSTIRVSNSLDPNQDRHYDRPVTFVNDLSPKSRYQQTTWIGFRMLSVQTEDCPIRRHFHDFSWANPLTNNCI